MIDFSTIFNVSKRTLRLLAALVWYGGCIALSFKAISLLYEAKALKPDGDWVWGTVFSGVIVGVVKSELLFSRSCQRNLARISALGHPKVWQFFRPSFFFFLTCMILLGGVLSSLANNSYPFLIGVAFIDLSIAIALLGSSRYFWKYSHRQG